MTASDPATLLKQADAMAADRNFGGALQLLDLAARSGADGVDVHLKRAAMYRATGNVDRALSAVSDGLRHNPLDFLCLLMRANLLDTISHPEAGEAYGRAIAQVPAGDLPRAIAASLDRARDRHAALSRELESALIAAMAQAETKATGEELERLSRFRSNAIRRTRVFHAEPTHFHYPGLREREFHDRSLFPWLDELEAATDVIQAECERAMVAERSELVPYLLYPDDVPLRQFAALNQSRDWTAIHLYRNGEQVLANTQHCPETMRLLSRLPQPHVDQRGPNAMFSLLAPRTRIPPHNGVANTRLLCHLPLIVPDHCWFRVGAERIEWQRGRAFVFDDCIEHEAANDSDQLRVVMIFDIWHPDLSAVERSGVEAMMGASAAATGQAL
jgi:aspartyl/asparaginyl beta-hydroxylase (cupin superfamily)